MKGIFVALALLATSATFAQQEKEKQPPPPPPPPPKVVDVKEVHPAPAPPPAPPVVALTEAQPVPPEPPIRPEENSSNSYYGFLKRNPTVKSLDWSDDSVRIRLKSGKDEIYDLKNAEEAQKFKDKYGELPAPPSPPPAPPKAPKKRTQA